MEPDKESTTITIKGEIGEMKLTIPWETDIWGYADVFQTILIFLGFTPETIKRLFSDEVTEEGLN